MGCAFESCVKEAKKMTLPNLNGWPTHELSLNER